MLSAGTLLLPAACMREGESSAWFGPSSGKNASARTAPDSSDKNATATPTGPSGEREVPTATAFETAAAAADGVKRVFHRVGLALDVLRVEVPYGRVSKTYQVWNQLDEQCIGADRVVLLKRNGLRVGVGTPEAWQPIHTVLNDISDTMVYRESANFNPGIVSLPISEGPDDQHVFFFRSDGSIAGWSFPASHNVLTVSHQPDTDDPNAVRLKIVPEIRQSARKLEWSKRRGRVVRVPQYHGRVLHELAVTITLPEGRFLAIGPSKETELTSVVGRALLTREVDGKRYESIFFLTPRIIRQGVHQPPSSP